MISIRLVTLGLLLSGSVFPIALTDGCDGETSQAPEWSSLPTITLESGQSTTLDLDAFLADGDTADSDLTVLIYGGVSIETVTASFPGGDHVIELDAADGFEGQVEITLIAEDPQGNSDSTFLGVVVSDASPTDDGWARLLSPEDGGTYEPTIWLSSDVSEGVVEVGYYAPWNGELFLLGSSLDDENAFGVSYTFSSPGEREVLVEAYNARGGVVATDSATITIEAASGPAPIDDGALGVWLWYIEGTGYTHTQLADKLAGMGVDRIYIKVADGTDLWWSELDEGVTDIYSSRGVEPWAWAYNYPGNESAQAEALYYSAAKGYLGFVTDIEIEFDGTTTALHRLFGEMDDARADAVADGHTTQGFPLYCTTWGNPADHGMRVDIIDQYVDGHMPQTYLEVWGQSYMNNATYWVDAGTAEYRAMGAMGPIHHIVSAEYNDISAATINELFEASGPESSVWRVPGTETPLAIWGDLEQVDWNMYEQDDTPSPDTMTFITPTDGGTYEADVDFAVNAPEGAVLVAYFADEWYLDESFEPEGGFPISYTFNEGGVRQIEARAYDSRGATIAEASITIIVGLGGAAEVIEDVPYYFQYDNGYNPSGSCQNTSLAMVLSYYGCPKTPDQISYAWGTDYAQTPAGLAEVFNSYARGCGISQRLTPHLDGRIGDVNALLAAGKPVIVHGYFTGYGHILPLIGYDGETYTANDPAGRWTENFKGGYYPSDSNDGQYVVYDADAVWAAIATLDGYNEYPIWYHEVN